MKKSKKILNILGALMLIISSTCMPVFAATSTPKKWVQNKTLWCWATSAMCVANNDRGNFTAPNSYVRVNLQDGIRAEHCGYDSTTGKYIVDRTQEYTVHSCSTQDLSRKDNFGAGTAEKKAALKLLTGRTAKAYGVYKKKAFSDEETRNTYIDSNLDESEFLLGDAFVPSTDKKGHTYVIVAKESESTYRIWDPWTNSASTHTANALFKTGFIPPSDPGITYYIECAIYLD